MNDPLAATRLTTEALAVLAERGVDSPDYDRASLLFAHAAVSNPGAFGPRRATGFSSRTIRVSRLTTAYTNAHEAIATHGALAALRQLALRPK